MAVNYQYITEKEDFLKAVEEINEYVNDELWELHGATPLIGVDIETFGELLFEKRVPLPIENEEGVPTGLIRTLQIGLNPVYNPKRPVNNKQYIFDCVYLGYDLVSQYLKPIIENCRVLGHNLKYEYQFHFMQLGIEIKHPTDLMLIGKVFLAGDPVNHGLGDYYKRFLDFNWFLKETGMTPDQYLANKKENQESDWSGELTDRQKTYAAEDVYFLFYVVEEQLEELKAYRAAHESDSNPHKKISWPIRLENDLIEVIAQAELRGVPLDLEKVNNTMRILDERAQEALDNLRFTRIEEVERTNEWCWLKEKGTENEGKVHRITGKNSRRWTEKVVVPLNIRSTQQLTPILNTMFQRDLGPNFRFSKIENGVEKDSVSDDILKNAFYKNIEDLSEETRDRMQWIFQYRKSTSLKSKCKKWEKACTKRGFIHCNWHSIGADDAGIVTGRMSSSQPNCQQIPSKDILFTYSKFGEMKASELFRSCFSAKPGWKMVVADLKQIEPRVAAELCKVKSLIKGFQDGTLDIHAWVAMIMMDLPCMPDKDSFERKYIGKTAGLSILYGKFWTTLKEWMFNKTDGKVKWSDEEAEAAWNKFFENAPEFRVALKAWERKAKIKAESNDFSLDFLKRYKGKGHGFYCMSHTVKGRPRRFTLKPHHYLLPDACLARDHEVCINCSKRDSKDNLIETRSNIYKERLRAAVVEGFNARIQGTAADILKLGALYTHRALKEAGFPWEEGIVLFVHDELGLHVREEHAELAEKILKESMERAGADILEIVPVEADSGIGDSWYSAKP